MRYLTAIIILCLAPSMLLSAEQTIQLHEGSNYVSFNVDPLDFYQDEADVHPSMELIIDYISDFGTIDMVKNVDGDMNLPDHQFWGIDYWELSQSYILRTNEDFEFTIEGEQIHADRIIQLHQGLNLLPYYPAYELDISAPDYYAISSIIDYVVLVEDDHGGFINFVDDTVDMDPWTPGEGYFLQLSEAVEFVYPAEMSVRAEEHLPGFAIKPNYPNPFNAQTTIPFFLDKQAEVNIQVFDILGRSVSIIANGAHEVGYYRTSWNATGQAAGVYIVRFQAGDKVKHFQAVYHP